MQIDREAPLRFLKAAFLPDDWIAVLLKRHDTGEAIQRVGPLGMVLSTALPELAPVQERARRSASS